MGRRTMSDGQGMRKDDRRTKDGEPRDDRRRAMGDRGWAKDFGRWAKDDCPKDDGRWTVGDGQWSGVVSEAGWAVGVEGR